MAGNKTKEGQNGYNFFGAALRGLISGVIAVLVLWLILTAILVRMNDPSVMIGVFSIATLYIGAFLTGIVAGKSANDNAISSAILGGAMYVLLVFLASLFFRDESQSKNMPLIMAVGYFLCLLVAFLGGVISRPRVIKATDKKRNPALAARRKISAARH